MSSLQCPARFVVVPEGASLDMSALLAENPSQLYADGESGIATEVAARLSIAHRRLDDAGTTGGVTGLTAALEDLADLSRGECVAVVVARSTFAELVSRVLPDGGERAHGLRAEVDDDGQRWRSWPSAAS